MRPALLNLRRPSLLRANLLVLASLGAACRISGFPNNRATLLLLLPALIACYGTWEAVRCMQRRWSFYHGGVIISLYMDLMAIAIVLFLLLYPYMHWLSATH